MYTKEELKEFFKKMGLSGEEAIMVHSSMKSIGEVEGGADTVVDAFMEYFANGLFMTPTHTWDRMNAEYNVFNPKTESVCVGIIPDIFRQREGVVRSLHPTHSIAAYGKGAEEYIKGEENAVSPCPPGGCWDRLREVDAKILLLGVTHKRNTYIHSIDEVLDIPDRLTDAPTLMRIVMPDNSLKDVQMYRHYNSKVANWISEEFDKLIPAFEAYEATKNVKFGDADCILCDARKIFTVCEKIFTIDSTAIVEMDSIPEEWWKE